MEGFYTRKALPYQLSMQFERESLFTTELIHFCGATLITSKFAISALHCFSMMFKGMIYDVDHNSSCIVQLRMYACLSLVTKMVLWK